MSRQWNRPTRQVRRGDIIHLMPLAKVKEIPGTRGNKVKTKRRKNKNREENTERKKRENKRIKDKKNTRKTKGETKRKKE